MKGAKGEGQESCACVGAGAVDGTKRARGREFEVYCKFFPFPSPSREE
jgi:hypothetical protein